MIKKIFCYSFLMLLSAGRLAVDNRNTAGATLPDSVLLLSKDGNLWLSVAPNVNGMGFTLPYLVKVDPVTLEYEIIDIPDGIYAPANSRYAWMPDGFYIVRAGSLTLKVRI